MSGKIFTFYSFKGGSGRSMALSNVAFIMATSGYKVLAIDWDLEAPGLHRYFKPLLQDPDLISSEGLIDFFWNYIEVVYKPQEDWPEDLKDPLDLASPWDYLIDLPLPDKGPGQLCLMSAGRQDNRYAMRAQAFDWSAFYSKFGGLQFLERFKELVRQRFDYILIDSRTGLADTVGVCTISLPDVVVHCVVANQQSIFGTVAVAESIRRQNGNIIQYPVPMRVEKNVPDLQEMMSFLQDKLDDYLPQSWKERERAEYWLHAEIVYRARYAREEMLASIMDSAEQRNTLLSDMMWLTRFLLGTETIEAPVISKSLRQIYQARARFGDPRIAEIKNLFADPSAAYSRLSEWLTNLRQQEIDSERWINTLITDVRYFLNYLVGYDKAPEGVSLFKEAVLAMRKHFERQREKFSILFCNLLVSAGSVVRAPYLTTDEATSFVEEALSIIESVVPNESNTGPILSIILSAAGHYVRIGENVKSLTCVSKVKNVANERMIAGPETERILVAALATEQYIYLEQERFELALAASEEALGLLDGSSPHQSQRIWKVATYLSLLHGQIKALHAIKNWSATLLASDRFFAVAEKHDDEDEIYAAAMSKYASVSLYRAMAIQELNDQRGAFDDLQMRLRKIVPIHLHIHAVSNGSIDAEDQELSSEIQELMSLYRKIASALNLRLDSQIEGYYNLIPQFGPDDPRQDSQKK